MSWYQDAVVYQVHVRAFCDSNQDGIGDFAGLTKKLDYIRDLGVSAIWVLPFYPSPLKDDGYDIADYRGIHPHYGSMRDFRVFLREAHRRGLRVITEMVLNHCSDQAEWFQKARRAPAGDPARDFFVWSDTPQKYADARIIFQDFEPSNWSWDPVAGAYYWHRFYHHQPDLNYEHQVVRREMTKALDYWLDMGVDGVRLDAVPYLFEREGTNCENLPETHAFLKELRAHVEGKYDDRMFLAEANQWPEDAVAYFGDGDECHAAFHFPVMPRLFMAVQMEDRFPLIDILEQTPDIPADCQWFVFLRNHDELTLEMVTDEERDYMYRMYARDPQARLNLGIRRRLAPLLDNDRRKIELLNGLLMSLPGTPVIYYGDELGMGDNIWLGDRDGVRTPMQWSADRNAGFSRANPQRLFLPVIIDHEYHYEAVNVETQQRNPHSLLWWTRRVVALRQQHRQLFGNGRLELLFPENAKVLAFLRSNEQECILAVANLSRFAQFVQLDLSQYEGMTPRELFGQTPFPQIGELPYLLTLGPYAFHWFALERSPQSREADVDTKIQVAPSTRAAKTLKVQGRWSNVLEPPAKKTLEEVLASFLFTQSWYESRSRDIRSVMIEERIPLESAKKPAAWLVLVRAEFTDDEHELYLLPMAFSLSESIPWTGSAGSPAVIAALECEEGSGILYDAFGTEAVNRALFDTIYSRRRTAGQIGRLVGKPTKHFRSHWPSGVSPEKTQVLRAGQSSNSLTYDDRLLLKVYRLLDEGISPDEEIRSFLLEYGFEKTPSLAGTIHFEDSRNESRTVGILQEYIRHEGTVWQTVLDASSRHFEEILSATDEAPPARQHATTAALWEMLQAESQVVQTAQSSAFLPLVELLGTRTAEMHRTLASAPQGHRFEPEPMTSFSQRSLYQRMRSKFVRVLRRLKTRSKSLPEQDRHLAEEVSARERDVLSRFAQLTQHRIPATRIRCHGNYHLGNLLYTGKDFMLINFEGLADKSVTERRLKRSPLRDVAELMHSFGEACFTGVDMQRESGIVAGDQVGRLQAAARQWLMAIQLSFLKSYLEKTAETSLIPTDRGDTELLLDVFRLERAIEQVGFDLTHRAEHLGRSCSQMLEIAETS